MELNVMFAGSFLLCCKYNDSLLVAAAKLLYIPTFKENNLN